MPSDGRLPACHARISPDGFLDGERYRDALPPCRYCFPDGEIDVDAGELVVADTDGSSRRRVHRHRRTGPLDYGQPGHHGTSLAKTIEKHDGDLSHPEVQAMLGGEG